MLFGVMVAAIAGCWSRETREMPEGCIARGIHMRKPVRRLTYQAAILMRASQSCRVS